MEKRENWDIGIGRDNYKETLKKEIGGAGYKVRGVSDEDNKRIEQAALGNKKDRCREI